MADQVFTLGIKAIGDFSDVKSNVEALQKSLSRLKMPEKLGNSLNKNIDDFYKAYEKYQEKLTSGINTKSDLSQQSKNIDAMVSSYEKLISDFGKISNADFKEMFKLDTGAFEEIHKKLLDIQKEFAKIKLNPEGLDETINKLSEVTKAKGVTEAFKNLKDAFAGNELEKAKEALAEIDKYLKVYGKRLGETKEGVNKKDAITSWVEPYRQQINEAEKSQEQLNQKTIELNNTLNTLGQTGQQQYGEVNKQLQETVGNVERLGESTKNVNFNNFDLKSQATQLESTISRFFGLQQTIRKVIKIAREAFATVKELDKAMTETTVVTNFSVSDMWEMLPTYTEQANKLGSTIKDVYEATTLYYQQGLNTNQAMSLANETLKMARISGLEAAEATDAMTAALRGFNMQINEASAQKINDVYSNLAANTASNVEELSTAMEKVASLAHSAGMEFETTSAFLAQMIETTREAPENLGTALKTVIARFQEMKKNPLSLVDSEGVAMDVNKVDTALKSIGVSLTDAQGNFRNLDEVFLEISSKWDSLTMGQQRYIATMAAGSRQQSRFIAMMSDYKRTMELVEFANNSAGASQHQFEKTLDSMESKLNKLKNAWNEFTMGLMNNQLLKTGVDLLTQMVTILNKFNDSLSKIAPKPFEGITKSIITLISTLSLLKIGGRFAIGGARGFSGVVTGSSTFREGFSSGFHSFDREISEQIKTNGFYNKGIEAGKTFNRGLKQGIINSKVELNSGQQALLDYYTVNPKELPIGIENKRQARDELSSAGIPISKLGPELKKELYPANVAMEQFGSRVQSAGFFLQGLGAQIQSPIGPLLSGLGRTLSLAGAACKAFGDSEVFAAVSTGQFSKALSALFAHPVFLTFTVLASIFLTIKLAVDSSTAALKRAQKAANAADDAYDSLKQSVSELKTSIEELEELDDSFDGLVHGSQEFYENIVQTNEAISELIKKFPELLQYVTFDEFGRMKINKSGLNKYYKKLQDQQIQSMTLSVAKNNEANILSLESEYAEKQQQITLAGNNEEKKERLRLESKSIREQINSQKEINSIMVARASLTGKDLKNADAVAAIYADQYKFRKAQAEEEAKLMSKEEKRRLYAKFNGYTIEGNKFIDSSGEEIGKIDDKIVEDSIVDIKVITNFSLDAEEFDKQLSSASEKVNESISADWDSDFLTKILSKDISIDEELLSNSIEGELNSTLAKSVDKMDKEEIAIILNVDVADIDENNIKDYRQQAKEYLLKNATNIYEAQQAAYKDVIGKLLGTGISFDSLSSEQKAILASGNKKIEETIGKRQASTFVKELAKFYKSGVDNDAIQETNKIVSNIDWSSPISQLEAYNKLMDMNLTETIQLAGTIKNISGDNLITDSISEFISSQDWADLSENMDEFVDSSGKIDATGIMKMAEQSSLLNRLLETNTISAGGLAAVLNAIGSDGNLTLLDLNDRIINMIDNFSELDNVIAKAHKSIEEFKHGLDTGEGEDFLEDLIKSIDEYLKEGELGNLDLQSEISFIFGADNWAKIYKENNWDYEKAYNSPEVKEVLSLLRNGGPGAIWEKLAKKVDKWDPYDIIQYDNEGNIFFDATKYTLEDMADYLQKNTGLSEDMINILLEYFSNYSPDLRHESQLSAFMRQIKPENGDMSFYDSLARNSETGAYIISDLELKTYAEALQMPLEDVEKMFNEAAEELGLTVDKLILIDEETGKIRTDWGQLNQDISKKLYGENATQYEWINFSDLKETQRTGKQLGLTEDQIYGAMYDALKNGGYPDAFYNGVKLDPTSIHSIEDLKDIISEINEEDIDGWKAAGEVIGETLVNALAKTPLGKLLGLTPKEAEQQQPQNRTEIEQTKYEQRSLRNPTTTSESNTHQSREEIITEISVEKQNDFYDALALLKSSADEHYTIDVDIEAQFETLVDSINYFDKLRKDASLPLPIRLQAEQQWFSQTQKYIDLIESGNYDIEFDSSIDLSEAERKIAQFRAQQMARAITLSLNFNKAEKGQNNYISYSPVPTAGSAAKGKYGRVGPKDKGGLTLTGEEGFEIAWLPGESRSVILGAGGPQMVNLPKDAVVYTHEQSLDIMKRKSIPAGSHARMKPKTNTNTTKTKPKSVSTTSGSGDNQVVINFSMEEVKRYNYEKQIDSISNSIDTRGKTIEKLLDKIGIKTSDVASTVNKQITELTNLKTYNNKLAASFEKNLKELDTGNYKEKISWSTGGKKNKEDTVNLSNYIKKVNGVYQIDYDKLSKEKDRGKREAIFKAAQSALDPLVNGLAGAKKASQEAADQIEELKQQMTDTFYAWENEITRIYNATQKLDSLGSYRDRFGEEISKQTAKLTSGITTLSKAFDVLDKVTIRQNDTIRAQINVNKEMIAAQQERLDKAISAQDEMDEYVRVLKAGGNNNNLQLAKDRLETASLTLTYLKNLTKNIDGTYTYDIDYQKLEQDRLNDNISEETYNSIKDKLDEINSAQVDVNNAIKDGTNFITELNNQFEEYRDTLVSMEDELLKGLEEEVKTEIDNNKKLSDTISKALKNLLDQVKKKLDERRKKEDNEKTETDISKKQQRLAMLRADTAGGHAVEIAQLEKEIEEAQQSYQRTLEDQLLQRMQDQADEAQKQRERQIEIAQAQLEIQSLTGQNIELVKTWLENPENYQSEITTILKQSRQVDEKGYYGQQQALDKISADIFKVYEASYQISDISNSLKTIIKNQQTDSNSLDNITTEFNTSTGGENIDKKANYQSVLAQTIKDNKVDKNELKNVKTAANAAGFSARTYIEDLVKNGLGWVKVLTAAKDAGWNKYMIALTWNQKGFSDLYDKVYGKGAYAKNRAEAIKKGLSPYQYASGGLASQTGLAWLDGTPSKPELVLNAQDTKNFLMLKDVLSQTMRNIPDNSNIAAAGDATYEININVDHLNSDYDVDKVAERVKKIIVKDSSYRNVTQVRKFR